MIINQLYLWSKKLHRLTMWLAIVTGVPLALTGLLLDEGGGLQVRAIHRLMSKPFALSLALMMVTGLVMWAVPKVLEIERRKKMKGEEGDEK